MGFQLARGREAEKVLFASGDEPRLLDLYCGAGGAAMGYHRAGFYVVGVDVDPQPEYPFEFHQADAVTYCNAHAREFDAFHASPPCQRYSSMRLGRWKDRQHPDLIGSTREALEATGKPYVIENVPGSPLRSPVMLCGTMFGLGTKEGSQLRRHRLFESNFGFRCDRRCNHNGYAAIGVYGGGQHSQRRYNESCRTVSVPPGCEYRRPTTIGVWGHAGGRSRRDGYNHYGMDARRQAMGIQWMNGESLSEAIPPAYTEFIGAQLRETIHAS